MKLYNIAVVGATGVVGRETLDILSSRDFAVNKIFAVASENSLGKKVSFGDQDLHVDMIDDIDWSIIDIVFASAGSKTTQSLIPKLHDRCILIDKTSAYRLDDDVPLIIPEINAHDISLYGAKNIISNPNCCVIPLALTLHSLGRVNPIKRVVISTYQSISGAGTKAMEDLHEDTIRKFGYINNADQNHGHDHDQDENETDVSMNKSTIAFNIRPQIGDIGKNGYSDEENKIILELQRLMGHALPITVTSVRVPVFIGHCFSVNIEFEYDVDLSIFEKVIKNQPGLEFSDKILTPVEISGTDTVHICRMRLDNSCDTAINLWIASDNLRKGAALNAVQIAEHLINII